MTPHAVFGQASKRRPRKAGQTVGVALLVSACLTAPTPTDRLASTARDYHQSERLHGGVLVADADEVLYAGAFGLADRDRAIPNTVETRFPIHSITKPFNAILILQLVEDGMIELDGTLSDYLPELPAQDWAR